MGAKIGLRNSWPRMVDLITRLTVIVLKGDYMNDSQQGGTWPEQDAVDNWLRENNINVTFKQSMRLKEAVTVYRLKIQEESQKELELTKIDMLPWWRKDKLGWPITTFKNKPVKSAVRIILQNIKKLC